MHTQYTMPLEAPRLHMKKKNQILRIIAQNRTKN
jgi:hypothetical protein